MSQSPTPVDSLRRTLARKLTDLVTFALIFAIPLAWLIGWQCSDFPRVGLVLVALLAVLMRVLLRLLAERATHKLMDPIAEFLPRIGRPDERMAPYEEFESIPATVKRALTLQEEARREQVQAVARTEKILNRRSEELRLLHGILEAFSRGLHLPRLSERVLEQAGSLVSFEFGTLYSLDDEGRFHLQAAVGLSEPERAPLGAVELTVSSLGFSELIRSGQVLRIQEEPLIDHPMLRGRFPPERVGGYHAFPMAAGGLPQGFLELVTRTNEPLGAEVQELVTGLARVLGVAIQNFRLLGQLRREKLASEAVLEHMADGVFTLNSELRLTSFNQAAERITGWPRAQLMGLTYGEVFSDPDGQRELGHILDGSQPTNAYEREVPVRDGLRKVVAFNPTLFREGEPSDQALIVVFRDISKVRELEVLRGDFTATLSHELRTPITCIKGYLHNMMHKKYRFEPETTRSHLADINNQADRLNRLIQDLLEAARLDSQALEVRPRNVDLAPLITRVVEAYRSKCEQSIQWEPPGHTPASCDPDQIRYVMDHLMSNAIKYSVAGGRVEVRCTARGPFVSISVRDEGLGIPFEHQDKIFEKYHRVEIGNTRTHYGVGLGLYIARKVIEAHGGQITVDSSPGCGSTFTITVPAAGEQPKEEGRSQPAPSQSAP